MRWKQDWIYTVRKAQTPFSTWKIISNKIMTPHPQDLPPGSLKNYPISVSKKKKKIICDDPVKLKLITTMWAPRCTCLCPWCVAVQLMNRTKCLVLFRVCTASENALASALSLTLTAGLLRYASATFPPGCSQPLSEETGNMAGPVGCETGNSPPTGNPCGLRIPTDLEKTLLDCCPPRCSSLKLPFFLTPSQSQASPLLCLPIFPYRCFPKFSSTSNSIMLSALGASWWSMATLGTVR